MMTGKSPAASGIYHNMDREFRQYDDLKNLTTIPQYFSQQGYKSWGVGKLLHNFDRYSVLFSKSILEKANIDKEDVALPLFEIIQENVRLLDIKFKFLYCQ